MLLLFALLSDFLWIRLCFVKYAGSLSRNHTLPPLPKNGPTVEIVAQELEIKGVDNSPVPSATTSRDEENDEMTEATEDQPIAAAAEGKRTRKKL